MYLQRILKSNIVTKTNLTSILSKYKHRIATHSNNTNVDGVNYDDNIEELINKYEDTILYNSVIEKQKLKLGFRKNKAVEEKISKEHQKHLLRLRSLEPLPVSLKYFNQIKSNESIDLKSNHLEIETKPNLISQTEDSMTHFPYESFDKIGDVTKQNHNTIEAYDSAEKEVTVRKEHYEKNINSKHWMTDYENFDDRDIDTNEEDMTWKLNYGTPDPHAAVSNVPCGGCGSLLHCKDSAIPGYLPSEIFKNHRSYAGQHLRTLICQRCHFLKNYDMALQVRVSPEDYPKILRTISDNPNALVILMVDLLDFPCSIWPNVINIIGRKRPIIVVGNKVDLLPQDSNGYLNRIKQVLADNIQTSGLTRANIQHVSLISAKTGYGVEELITKLHSLWEYKGDVYLVGCTNVGKSTLFNVLLQSDYCKIKAVDLVQRATTSIWPGTTLNLLKFPILRPSGWRLFVRTKRLISLNKIKSQEERLRKSQLRNTRNPKYATLMGHIERTFTSEEPVNETSDIFSLHGHSNASGKVRVGINENDPNYKLSKWCYDTPGVVQPDQILHLLTTEELMLTLPKQMIQPRTYSLKPGNTIFIGGLGRLDYLEGPVSIRFTVFASDNLPITICPLNNAENLYKELLGTELFQVPVGNQDRLEKWPQLMAGNEIRLTGVDWESSCADILLSSAGWISISLGSEMKCSLRAWTPDRRGIYVRDSILSKAVTLRGRRIRFSPAYRKSHFYVN